MDPTDRVVTNNYCTKVDPRTVRVKNISNGRNAIP